MDVSEREKERELFISRAGSNSKKERKKNRLVFGSVLVSASSFPSRRKAPSMLIRRAATREGAFVEQNRRKRGEHGETSGRLAARSPSVRRRRRCCSISLSLSLSFDTALWRSFRDASTLGGSIATPDLCLRPLEAESTGGERGSTRAKAALATVFYFILFSAPQSVGEMAKPRPVAPRLFSRRPRLPSVAIEALSDLLSGRKESTRRKELCRAAEAPHLSSRKKGGEEGQATAFSKKTSSRPRPRPHSSKK